MAKRRRSSRRAGPPRRKARNRFGNPSRISIHAASRSPSPQTAHAKLIRRIAALEEVIGELRRGLAPGIGHNRPPDEPVSEKDLDGIETLIAGWKSEITESAQPPREMFQEAIQLKKLSGRIQSYLSNQADVFVSEVVKSGGHEIGKWSTRGILLWLALHDRLIAVHDAVIAWLRSLGVPI